MGWVHAGQCILENVRLRADAFEYLQLPFAVKEGCIGRLQLQVGIPSAKGAATVPADLDRPVVVNQGLYNCQWQHC